MQMLTFFIAGEEYAIGILKVKEIIEFEAPTRVPSTPPCVTGVINLRGTVVPVIDLAAKLGLATTEVTKRTCIIIVETATFGEETVMGLMADAVSQVIDLNDSDVQPPPSFGTKMRADLLQGMAGTGKRFILLLDIDRVVGTLDVADVIAAAGPAGEVVAG
jgi:purine-binding chemotaxis protein CheW